MSKPIVAVVGRPNVGKSTLFNKLCGQRLAIVEDTPGITRDRIFANCEWSGHEFLLVDTGGIEPKATEGILAHMREQAQIAIDTADCIIMVVDVRNGLTAADEDVAHMLRRSHKPIILAVNKCDNVGETPMELYEFYNLGFDEVMPISSVHGHGTGDLLAGATNSPPTVTARSCCRCITSTVWICSATWTPSLRLFCMIPARTG